jgi:excisionase family DNA binding protein
MTEQEKLRTRFAEGAATGSLKERKRAAGDEASRQDGGQSLAPITVRVPKAVELTGLSRTKLYELIKAKEIEVIKVGSSTLIVVASLHQFVERRRS